MFGRWQFMRAVRARACDVHAERGLHGLLRWLLCSVWVALPGWRFGVTWWRDYRAIAEFRTVGRILYGAS